MNSAAFRVAQVEDAAAIAAFSAELGYPADPDRMASRLARILGNPQHLVLVATPEPGVVAGWIHGFLNQLVESDYRMEIGGLVVGQRFKRRGLGRLLVRQLEAWARDQGAVEVSVRCQVKRAEAHLFYEALGFQITKTQHVFRRRVAPEN